MFFFRPRFPIEAEMADALVLLPRTREVRRLTAVHPALFLIVARPTDHPITCFTLLRKLSRPPARRFLSYRASLRNASSSASTASSL